jgi:xanthine dehydrogenase accessory factor
VQSEQLFRRAVEEIQAGRRVAIATVVGCLGSTPRHLGAKMAVSIVDGGGDDQAFLQWSTIGGGRVEHEVTRTLIEVARSGQGRKVEHHLVRDLAMCCGGSMTFALTYCNPFIEVLQQVVTDAQSLQRGVLQTNEDGSGLRWLPQPADVTQSPVLSSTFENGRLEETLGVQPRAIVFGAGHVGKALGPLLHATGFAVVICDDEEVNRDDGGRDVAELPSWAFSKVSSFAVKDVEHQIGPLGGNDYVLIVTRDHAMDQSILETLIARDHGEIGMLGMIGSRGKVARFAKRLTAKGIINGDEDPKWRRLVAPIGLDIAAETPTEIAIAVVAQLILYRRTGTLHAGHWGGKP